LFYVQWIYRNAMLCVHAAILADQFFFFAVLLL